MKAVIFYEHATDKSMDEFMAVFHRHEEFEAEFIKSGKVLGTGAFGNPGEGEWQFLSIKNRLRRLLMVILLFRKV